MKDKEKELARKKRYRDSHREQLREWDRKYYQEHKEKRHESARKKRAKYTEEDKERERIHAMRSRHKLRRQVLDFLGPKCARCGYDEDIRALQIDHINGGGCAERKNFKSVAQYYKHVMEVGSTEYQVLCANCNQIKRIEQNENRTK